MGVKRATGRAARGIGLPIVVCFVVSCADGGARPSSPAAPAASVAPSSPSAPPAALARGPRRCPLPPSVVDVADLLGRHTKGYGSADAVAAQLPVTLAAELDVAGSAGKSELVLTAGAHRWQLRAGAFYAASGIDDTGSWTHASGLVQRESGPEAVGTRFDAWLFRRAYATSFVAARDKVRCENIGSGDAASARVDLGFGLPELGVPTLSFDLESAALLAYTHETADSRVTRTTYEAWSEADRGVRWPKRSTSHPNAGTPVVFTHAPPAHGTCLRFDPTGVDIPQQGAACLAPLGDRFTVRFPTGGDARVRVPMSFVGGHIVLRAKIGAREVVAFLDSGGTVTHADATSRAGTDIQSTLRLPAMAGTTAGRAGYGEIATMEIGALHTENVPTAIAALPSLDVFGDKKPEILIGFSLFAAAVIRVDYKRLEITIAPSTAGMFAKGNEPRAVPLRVLKGSIVADGIVEGAAAPLAVTTVHTGGLHLFKKWATAHGVPGTRPTVEANRAFAIGDTADAATYFRAGKASFGPITWDDRQTQVEDRPGGASLAGAIGNAALARCDAVVFDVPKRTLWLEGACDRAVIERKMGWRFAKKVDPAYPDRPWVVDALWSGGAAERAGIHPGDRVLEVGAKPATLDVASLWAVEEQAAGTKVPVTVIRAGAAKQRERVIIELRSPPP